MARRRAALRGARVLPAIVVSAVVSIRLRRRGRGPCPQAIRSDASVSLSAFAVAPATGSRDLSFGAVRRAAVEHARPRPVVSRVALRAQRGPEVVIQRGGKKVTSSTTEEDVDLDEVCVVDYEGRAVSCRPVAGGEADSLAIVKVGGMDTYKDWVDSNGQLDPYKVLGLKFMASKDDIREAYVQLCKTEHPDLNGGLESERWLIASKAYRLLNEKGNKYVVNKTAQSVSSIASAFASAAFAFGSIFAGAAAGAVGAAAGGAATDEVEVAKKSEEKGS